MPHVFANKLDELLKVPLPVGVVEFNQYHPELTDAHCDLLDELEDLAHQLFDKSITYHSRSVNILKTRGYELTQSIVDGKQRIIIKTHKGELRF